MKKFIVLLAALLWASSAHATTTHYSFSQPTIGNTTNWGLLLNSNFSSIDSTLWSASGGMTVGVNVASSGSNITLTNTMNNVQKITTTLGSLKLILPAMNATASMVPGGFLTVINAGSNAFQIVANDGSTNVLTSLAAGQAVYIQLLTNSTANGTFQVVSVPSGTPLLASNNLSDVVSVSTSRTNLGLGTAAVENTTAVITDNGASGLTIGAGQVTAAMLVSSLALPDGTTATTQSASDNSTKIATTAYADAAGSGGTGNLKVANNLSDVASVATSLSNLGFAKNSSSATIGSGGTIIKYGTSTTSGGGTVSVSFGSAFPNNLYAVVALGTTVGISFSYSSAGTSGFTLSSWNSQSGILDGSRTAYWVAVGN